LRKPQSRLGKSVKFDSSKLAAKVGKKPKPEKATKAPKPSRFARAAKVAKGSKASEPNVAVLKRESKRQKVAAKRLRAERRSISNVVELAKFGGASKVKRTVILSSLGAFLVLIALVLAAVFSPMMAVERISVRGEKLVSEKQIKAALKSQIGKPLPQINSEEIAGLLKKYVLIESFSAISAPPHTLIIKVTERTPIAIIWVDGFGYSYFDPAGVKVGKATRTDQLPILKVSGTPGKSPSFKAAIDVLLALPANLLPKISNMTATSADNVSFQLRGYAGQRVIWGGPKNAVLKSKVLAALIKNQPASDRVTYDVSSPNAPVVRY
jgi:cell division protein FtsQ